MTIVITRMSKIDFDGFFTFLEETNFDLCPYPNTEEGYAVAARFTIIHKLRETEDYAYVYNAYERYRKMKKIPNAAKIYKADLDQLRDQCFD